MARRSVQVAGEIVWIADDDPLPPELGWWAVLRTRVVDEITEAPPVNVARILDATPRLLPRVGADGLCGLVARPRDVSNLLVTPGALRATIAVDGYLPQVLDGAIDGARRQLPAGAAAGASIMTITPPEAAGRPQFQPGRGVMLERPAATDAEQFSLHAEAAVAVAANQVAIVDTVQPARAVNAHLAGVPVVLPDQRLHRAEPALIRGIARRQTAPGSAAIPAPGAQLGITGTWWTQAEIAANSAPPHPPRIVSLTAPLAQARATGATLERATLAPDGVARACAAAVDAGATTLSVQSWAGLGAAGGDVLQLEADASGERELVVTDGFDDTIDAAMPALVRPRTPLAFPHRGGTVAMRVGVAVFALGTLEREAVAGDRVLYATNLAGLAPSDLVRIGGVAPDAELRFVRCQPTYDGAFANPVAIAADGSFTLPPIARAAQLQFFVQHAGHPAQPTIDFVPEPGSDNVLQVLFTP